MRLKGLRGKSIIVALALLLLTSCGSNVPGIRGVGYGAGELPEGKGSGFTLRAQATITPGFGETPPQQVPGYDEYVALEDETGALYVEVPAAWDDVDRSSLTNDQGEVFAASIKASTNIDGFDDSYDVPGVHFIAFRVLDEAFTVDDLLDEIDFEECQYEGRQDYEDNLYTGKFDRYIDCEGGDTAIIVVAAMPPEGDFATLVVIQTTTQADLEAADRIADTFQVTGELPAPAQQDENLAIEQG